MLLEVEKKTSSAASTAKGEERRLKGAATRLEQRGSAHAAGGEEGLKPCHVREQDLGSP